MLFPVYDEDTNLAVFRPWTMWSLVAANTLIAVLLELLPMDVVLGIAYQFGLVPGLITGSAKLEGIEPLIRPALTLLTYGFVHLTWPHLVANMLILWVFGDNVEKATGHGRFLTFYLLCQIAGGVAQIVSDPTSIVPSIGASGAASGVIAGYLLLRPKARVVALVLGVMTIKLRAYWVIAAWIAWQIASYFMSRDDSGIAHWSHFGGFVMGTLLIVAMRRPGVEILPGLHPRTFVRKGTALFRRSMRRVRAAAWRSR